MEEKLMQDMKNYLGSDYKDKHSKALDRCVTRALNAYKSRREFPSRFTDADIEKDMNKHYECLFDLALYWYAKMGVEFQTSHSENTVSRHYASENDIYIEHMVFPYAAFIG